MTDERLITCNESLYGKYRRELKSGVVFGVIATIILLFLAVAIICTSFVFIKVKVSGASMESTLYSGDVVMVNAYGTPDYGDVIIISGEKTNGDWLIKRAIAFGGDTVKIKGGYVFLKKAGETEFTKLIEPYLERQGITFYPDVKNTNDTAEYVWAIEEGHIFYLGDNRKNSSDSRSQYGTCDKSQVIGVVSEFALKIKGVNNFLDRVSQAISGIFGS